jgi:NAD(P)-dependent dehydrogenase (short-subunit alcohol dehydrogenase family)
MWNKPVWKHDLANGLRMLRLAIDTHLITAHHALPLLIERPGGLLIEVTDGTAEYNAEHYRLSVFYDLSKTVVTRMAWAHAKDLAPFGGDSRIDHSWRDAVRNYVGNVRSDRGELARCDGEGAAFRHFGDAAVHRACRCGPRR